MDSAPSPTSLALLLGLSFFLGLAFEDFFYHATQKRPGGIRTFPLLATGGGMLYLLDPTHVIAFTAGLLVLGGLLLVYYRTQLREPDETGETNVNLVVSLLNLHAYVLGAVALALPPWIAVTMTVVAVLLLTSRSQLHNLAGRIDVKEIVTAGQFLILTGIILPLLPNEPLHLNLPLVPDALNSIVPRKIWLALVVVCTFSYVSYLAQRYWAAASGGLWMAALGGLYSSTATTVVLARQAKADPTVRRSAEAGITLATAIMYLRILAVTAIFNMALARPLALPMAALSCAGFVICALQYWVFNKPSAEDRQAAVKPETSRNPLELGAAAMFAALFVVVSVLTSWATQEFGATGIYALAAIVGVSDIDPFVLSLAQGQHGDLAMTSIVAAILIAASSNNILKAFYAAAFAGGRATAGAAVALAILAAAGLATAWAIIHAAS
jgi:uncharacterized membrane protein (DUF4010 family)